MPRRRRDEDVRAQPIVASIRRAEFGASAKVVFLGIDCLTVGEPLYHRGRAMTNFAVVDLDQRLVVGFEQLSGADNRRPVGARILPVGATGDRAPQALAFERPANDRDHAAQSARCGADDLRWTELDLGCEFQRCGKTHHCMSLSGLYPGASIQALTEPNVNSVLILDAKQISLLVSMPRMIEAVYPQSAFTRRNRSAGDPG